jgi:TPR repeat protein
MIRTLVIAGALLAFAGTSAQAFQRVPTSLVSESERAGPVTPDFKSSIFGGPIKKRSIFGPEIVTRKARTPKPVDPLKEIRNRMVAGKEVSDKELQKLADSGDDLAAYNFAKRIEGENDPERLDTAARYYLAALQSGRDSAVRPLANLLNAGVLDDAAEPLADAEAQFEKLSASNSVARDELIVMYRTGKPFGAKPARADELLAAAADAGDAKAALDLALKLMSGTPDESKRAKARAYLEAAAKAEDLSVRTMAENLLRTLEPQSVADATEAQP